MSWFITNLEQYTSAGAYSKIPRSISFMPNSIAHLRTRKEMQMIVSHPTDKAVMCYKAEFTIVSLNVVATRSGFL